MVGVWRVKGLNGEEKELELVEHDDKNWYGENNLCFFFFHVFQNKISKEQQHFFFFFPSKYKISE